ncbi:MAG: c-type cytochrome [Myxococcales bacterium]|nr:c-type cytochrome [Myxococcales bacterium]
MSRERSHRGSALGLGLSAVLSWGAGACDVAHDGDGVDDAEFRGQNDAPEYNVGSYNVHLRPSTLFEPTAPGADPDAGRVVFGLAPDLITSDPTGALFQGESAVAAGIIASNGRTCFTCHRGTPHDFGLPAPPLSDTIPLTDPLFTGLHADAQGDVDGLHNLDQLGLFKIRPNRFNVARDPEDPFVQVFGWRKSPAVVNIGFAHGLLTDMRGRTLFETARGAVFSHTQEANVRFDDLYTQQLGDDLAAFLFAQVTDPALLPLRDPQSAEYGALVDDPFATVPVGTKAEKKGKKLFEKLCMACHGTPNVFNDAAYLEPMGHGERPSSFPTWAPAIGRTYDIGVSEANAHGLRFTRQLPDGTFQPIVLPLAAEDGTLVQYEVQLDVGLAATTGRYEDVGRFKVPQLRNVSSHAPYFHDNSIDTLEGVVDYFCSDAYNDSKDGSRYPIHMNGDQRADLVAFLELL